NLPVAISLLDGGLQVRDCVSKRGKYNGTRSIEILQPFNNSFNTCPISPLLVKDLRATKDLALPEYLSHRVRRNQKPTTFLVYEHFFFDLVQDLLLLCCGLNGDE